MSEQPEAIESLAQQVKIALESADLSAFSRLLDPNVRWGAPDDDPVPSCQNREQVLAWYRRGRDAGVRARISEVVVLGDQTILAGLVVTGNRAAEENGGGIERWQLLTVRDGRVVDIVAYDDRTEAVARARQPRFPAH
jgi:ketosteroid isomerase-like protein